MLAGVHRARHLAKHLPGWGWRPVVLCVDEADHEQRLDHALAQLVPESVEVVKVRAMPKGISRRFGLGDISLRAWTSLRRNLFLLLRSGRFQSVLITGSPYYPMLLAPEIRRRFGIPVVLDFQDPWVSSWGAQQPAASKAGLSHRLACLLEPRALRGADYVTSVSDVQNAEMAARHPWFDKSRMAGIPIGGDPEDFLVVPVSETYQGALEPNRINLSYVGSFWPAVEESVKVLLRAFAEFQRRQPALAERVRLNFVGTNPSLDDTVVHRIMPLAAAEGVAGFVREIPQRLPYLQALGILARSDGLLLFGSAEPHYTASKIYTSLMSGRPFLSLFHNASSAHAILSLAGGGRSFAFADREELQSLTAPIADGFRALTEDPASLGRSDPAVYAPFEARSIAERFAQIFDRLACGRSSMGSRHSS
jgi:hypothetical protein